MKKLKIRELVRDGIFIIAIIVMAIINITTSCDNKKDEVVIAEPLPNVVITTSTISTGAATNTTTETSLTKTTESSLSTSTLTSGLTETSTIVTTTACDATTVEPPVMVANLPNTFEFHDNEPEKLVMEGAEIQSPVPEEIIVETTITETTTTVTTMTTMTTTMTTTETKKDTHNIYVYKPSTHFVHRTSCKWYDETCETIETTEGLDVLYCVDCNPDIEIYSYYNPVQSTITAVSVAETPVYSGTGDYDRELLAQIVWHEAGSDWISTYDKAMVAAGVMNRVNDSRFPSTVYDVLTQPGQFTGYWPDCCTPTQSCYDAVDYYFNNVSLFGNHNSWWGDGVQNHFYYQ